MKAVEAVKQVMNEQGVGVTTLTARMGIERKKSNVISMRLAQDNISVEKLLEMFRVLDYKLVAMPADKNTPQGGIEIE